MVFCTLENEWIFGFGDSHTVHITFVCKYFPLSCYKLQFMIPDGRGRGGGGGNSYSFLHRGILPGSEILIFITFSIPLSHLTFRELCTFSEWIHTPTRRSKAMQMNVLQNGWFILAEQNFSRALSTLLPPGTAASWAWRTGEHTSSRILEIKGRPVLFDVNSLKNTAL